MVKEKSDKLISVYHYTNSRHYDSMINGNEDFAHHDIKTKERFQTEEAIGLFPRSEFIPKGIRGMGRLPNLAYSKISYALLSPEPEQWTSNKEFPKAFWALMEYMGDNGGKKVSLLEIDLLKTDEVYVVDAKHVVPFIFYHVEKEERLELYKNRFNTKISLVDYLNDDNLAQKFSLPEIVIRNPIPEERIRRKWEKSGNTVWKRGKTLYYQVHRKRR